MGVQLPRWADALVTRVQGLCLSRTAHARGRGLLKLAMGDTVILTKNDSNGSKTV
jgi:hypothetical protein